MRAAPKPSLPVYFTEVDNASGAYALVHGLLLWLGSGSAAYLIWQWTEWHWAMRLATALPCVVAAGLGMFYLGSLGHEGFHGSLHRNRHVSMVLGLIASLGAPLFLSVGVNVYHWRHHLHTNTIDDPDYLLYRGNRSLLARLRGPLDTTRYCAGKLARLLLMREPIDRGFPFSSGQMCLYAWLNLALVIGATVAFGALALIDTTAFAWLVGAPAVVAQAYWTIHPYIEHGGTSTRPGSNARNCTSWIQRVLLRGYTYHLCHHLYPRVQAHKLPALDRHLRQIGFFTEDAPRESTFLGALRVGLTRSLP